MPTRVSSLPFATPRQIAAAAAVAIFTGLFLAAGFIPVAQSLVEKTLSPWVAPNLAAWLNFCAFPLLALAFHLSFPRPRSATSSLRPWRSLPLAGGIALAYGLADGFPPFYRLLSTSESLLGVAWVIVLAPLGEELLFRGWVYSVAARLWRVAATPTNPLPLAVWVSAVAFSLWHTQNWGTEAPARVLFQIAFTLPAGLWLGWLRWKTGSLWAPLAAHWLMNFAAMAA